MVKFLAKNWSIVSPKYCQQASRINAIFDDLEDLMNQRGGEWDFKKNQDVHT